MANFLATLVNPATTLVSVSVANSVMSIVDYSNYSDGTESGHTQNDFSYFRKIKINQPDGTNYLLSSLGDGDAVCVAPKSQTLPLTDTYTYATGDGVYEIILYTLPTYNNSATYGATHYIYYPTNQKVYKAKGATTGNIPTNTTYWTEITDLNTLSSKYLYSCKVAIVCAIKTCLAQKISDYNCNFCNPCDERTFTSSVEKIKIDKLKMALFSIEVLAENEYWDEVTNIINFGKQICCCN